MKTKAILLSLFFGVVLLVKGILAKVFYPFAYLAKDWVYGNDVIKNYTIPKSVQSSWIKWIFWLLLDDDQPNGYPEWYATELLGYVPITKWDKLKCAYAWSGWRNSAYNVNYNYLSKPSPIVDHKIVFGKYAWNKKLIASNGDEGAQLVWMMREDGRTTYLFSYACQNVPLVNKPFTFYYGWNADTNGRFTIAMKFK